MQDRKTSVSFTGDARMWKIEGWLSISSFSSFYSHVPFRDMCQEVERMSLILTSSSVGKKSQGLFSRAGKHTRSLALAWIGFLPEIHEIS